MNISNIGTEGVLLLILYTIIRDVVRPLIKKISKRNNPNSITLAKLCQQVKDFKDTQEKWNEKREDEIKKLDDRLDKLERRK